MAAARNDWVRKSARPKAAHDRVGWQGIVQRGAPAYLGIGFGEGQIKRSQECMFGARFQLGPDVRLAEVVEALEQTASLMVDMAAVIPQSTLRTAEAASLRLYRSTCWRFRTTFDLRKRMSIRSICLRSSGSAILMYDALSTMGRLNQNFSS